jgi:hypothetical protein
VLVGWNWQSVAITMSSKMKAMDGRNRFYFLYGLFYFTLTERDEDEEKTQNCDLPAKFREETVFLSARTLRVFLLAAHLVVVVVS